MQEDEDGRTHLRNLSAQVARSEEEALNLLFMGDTNRVISETPMNEASSRSHCIFTIGIDARRAGSDVVRRSKLHLVDLAGSERAKAAALGSSDRSTKAPRMGGAIACVARVRSGECCMQVRVWVSARRGHLSRVCPTSVTAACARALCVPTGLAPEAAVLRRMVSRA